MGKKTKWFGAVRKIFSPESKEKNDQKAQKSLKSDQAKSEPSELESSSKLTCEAPAAADPPVASGKAADHGDADNENLTPPTLHAATTEDETVEVVSQTPTDSTRPRSDATRFPGKTTEEIAAIKIQTAFRGYLARRALRALRGLVRLKSLLHGNAVKRQSATTLRCMQTLSKVQTQIRARRIRMTEENQALQRQLQLKREKELEALRASMGEDWDDSLQSKEQIEASILSKHEAAIRRERALAYAFSHQWKNSSRSVNPLFTDPTNPHWGWSWLERWMAARPWETRSAAEKDLNNDSASVRSASRSVAGEINKTYLRRDSTASEKPSPTVQRPNAAGSRQSPATPPIKFSPAAGKVKPPTPGGEHEPPEEDSRSLASVQSERVRRHSIGGTPARDDENLVGSPCVPSYMAPTQSAKAKSRLQSPSSAEKPETPERTPSGAAKKRLSFPSGDKTSPAAMARRLSGPPKVDLNSSLKSASPARPLQVPSIGEAR